MPDVIRHPAGGGTGGLDARTPSGHLRRQGAYTVAPDMAVSGHEDEPFGLGLGDQ